MLQIYLSLLDSEEDKQKFEIIYTRYRDLMYHIANEILHDTYLAEDAVHQAFIKIIKSFSKVPESDSQHAKKLIAIITRNCAINEYNKRKKSAELPLYDFEMVISNENDICDNELAANILKLPEKLRDVVHMYFVFGFSIKEIAHVTERSERLIKMRISEARQLLRNSMEGVESDAKKESTKQ